MSSSLLILARALHYGSGMVLVGVMAFRWLVLLPAFADAADEPWQTLRPLLRTLNRLLVGSGITLLLSGFAMFWAVTAEMNECSLTDALHLDAFATVFFQTQFGVVCQWRLGLAVIFAILLGLLVRRQWHFQRNRSALETVMGIIAVALIVSVAWTGHAASSGTSSFPLRISADALHLLAAAIWPGGLLPFALFLSCIRTNQPALHSRSTLRAIHRFSNLSLLIVGVLIATGVINSFFLVGSFTALVTTLYGGILCLKLCLLLLILGVASWNRFRLLPLISKSSASKQIVSPLIGQLRNFVATEFALAVAIVVVVSVLGITPPPR
jgi:putative copper resistance protein D